MENQLQKSTRFALPLSEYDYGELNKLRNKVIDHHIVFYNGIYYVIAHGHPLGLIQYDGQIYPFSCIHELVYMEKEIDKSRQLEIVVCCCFGYYMKDYTTTNCTVSSLFDNQNVTYMKPTHNKELTKFHACFQAA